MSAALAAVCALLLAAAFWQIAGERGEDAGRVLRRRLFRRSPSRGRPLHPEALLGSLESRIEGAAMASRLTPAAVLLAKSGCAALAVPFAMVAGPHLDEACRGERQFVVGGEDLERGHLGAPVVDIAVVEGVREHLEVRVQHELALGGHGQHPRFVVGRRHVAVVAEPGDVFDPKPVHVRSPTHWDTSFAGK